ncbi:stage II sporulation protein P [Jeotgalibacillus aurantiacus]|uniref:stage II sporulation protein P n=1 Tax=Jeotgalibacillus aurantiacus TaxID=2763266 RepID=UPI001D09EC13|nr:stage II sporulation protein P [Jeotgalibacillus aurantiacus]
MRKALSHESVYLFLKTFLLLLSVMLTAVYLPVIKSGVPDIKWSVPDQLPDRWMTFLLQMEFFHFSNEDIAEQFGSYLRGTVSDPIHWLTMEGLSFTTASALSSEDSFPEPSESIPPEEWFLTGIEDDAVEPEEIAETSVAETAGLPERVLIYFTHSRESFLPYLPETKDPNKAHHSKVNIMQTGPVIEQALEKRGVGAVVNKTDIVQSLRDKGLDYWNSYDESRHVVEAAMGDNGQLTYLVDVHRDALRREATVLEHEGTIYAKTAFVVGGEHAGSKENQAFSEEIHRRMNERVPGISRGVYVKKGEGTNGKFNQDLSSRSVLLELGGVDNTFEELNRSAEIFAEVLSEMILQAEPVSTP